MVENRMSGGGSRTAVVLGSALFALLMNSGCGGTPGEGPPARSPSEEYPPPPAQSSDGEVVGADRVPAGEKLETSPGIGTEGVVPAAQPPHGDHGNRPSSEPRHPSR